MSQSQISVHLSQSDRKKYDLQKKEIREIVSIISTFLGLNDFDIHIEFVPSQGIKELNLTFRHIDKSTDVLSFPQLEWKKPLQPGDLQESLHIHKSLPRGCVLGDIVISLYDAFHNAESIGQSLYEEVRFLLIHGVLHLCGHDHIEQGEETIMLDLQQRVLSFILEKNKINQTAKEVTLLGSYP